MCIRPFVTILAGSCLLAVLAVGAGCTEAMRKDLDSAARGAAAGGKAAKDSLKSPAGDLVPEPVRSSLLAGAAGLEALALAWLKARKRQTDKKLTDAKLNASEAADSLFDHRETLQTLVAVIEELPAELQKTVKGAIAQRMAKTSAGNVIVDDIKACVKAESHD